CSAPVAPSPLRRCPRGLASDAHVGVARQAARPPRERRMNSTTTRPATRQLGDPTARADASTARSATPPGGRRRAQSPRCRRCGDPGAGYGAPWLPAEFPVEPSPDDEPEEDADEHFQPDTEVSTPVFVVLGHLKNSTASSSCNFARIARSGQEGELMVNVEIF